MMLPYLSMKCSFGVAKTLVVAFMLACLNAPMHAADKESRVVVLYGLDPYLPPFLAMDKAMRESLTDKTGGRVQFFPESLDSQRIAPETVEPEQVAFLTKKYKLMSISAVVAVSRTALDFFKRHGDKVWPGARLVYLGFLGYEHKPDALPLGATAVVSILDVAGTIEIARKLQPNARRMLVISGMSEIDRTAEQQARSAIATQNGLPSIEFLSGLPLPELVTQVAATEADSIVIYLAQFRDRDGQPYDPLSVLRAVVESSRAPVYGAAETYIGLGAVAASAASYESRGRLIGEQVHYALMGSQPDPSRTVLEAPNQCIADALALQRWSLDEGRLPSGCELRYAVIPIWLQYGWQIALALAIVAAQAVLIAALLAQRRMRFLAEQSEQNRRSELAHAARFAVAGELTAAIAHEINQPLGAILSNADAGDLMLDSGKDQRHELRAVLADIRRDDLRASEVIRRLRDLLGKRTFERQDFDLNEIVDELDTIMRAEARRRGIRLDIRLSPEALVISGDRIQIQQVLINLVLNAMDAVADQPENRRAVAVTLSAAGGSAVLDVRDQGRGIAPQDTAKVFDSFFTTKPNGMGLGLSITRTIVEAHGGSICVDSAPREDTVFQAIFPMARSFSALSPLSA